MKSYRSYSKIVTSLVVGVLLMLAPCSSMALAAENTDQNKKSEQFVSIDFNNVDINVFIKFISELTGTNFVVDERVKGKVTIISPAKISVQEAYKVFESVLEVHGYTTVKAGEVIKIIPAPDARSKNIETRLKQEAVSAEDKVVTQLIHLKYADPNEIKQIFTPLVSSSSIILAYPPTNMLVLTDVYSNIQRLLRIVKAIDVTGVGRELSVIPLEFANATELVKLLSSVFKTTKTTRKGVIESEIAFVADDRTNTIIMLASEDETARIKNLIGLLDREAPRGKEKIRVFYLENATAEELAKVLEALPKQSAGAKSTQAPVISSTVKITPDKATNSLIIIAEKDEYRVLEEIIAKLDIPRAMVYIECLIMEVNINKDFNLGTRWIAGEEATFGRNNAGETRDGVIGGGFSGGTLGGEGGVSVGTNATLPAGFSLGVFGETINIGDISFPNIGAIVQVYKKDKDVHILSTPQILTTNNEEASITVGKNIPYVTRQETTDALRDYSSFEYKDVGISLKITPQISKDRMVKLAIAQELTKLESTTESRPTTLKRAIDTTVIVKDKNTVVIGGLIDDSFSATEYKTPCLGDIPGFRWFFRSVSDTTEKTNLFVFITPHVIKDPLESEAIFKKKKNQIDKIKEGNIKMYDTDTAEPAGNNNSK